MSKIIKNIILISICIILIIFLISIVTKEEENKRPVRVQEITQNENVDNTENIN